MEPINRLKALIYQIVGENKFIIDTINSIKHRDGILPAIELTCSAGSDYWHSVNIIHLSIQDIINCFNIAQNFNLGLSSKVSLDVGYNDYRVRMEKCKGITVNMPMLEFECEQIINSVTKTNFLEDNHLSLHDALTAYSMAYSLYHEIGHAYHDKYIPESDSIMREKAADTFAFEAMKSLCGIEDKNILLLGNVIGISQVFNKLSYCQEKDDDKHPYTIERLYNLLDFWKLDDNSHFWHLTNTIVKKWCIQNELSIEWDIDNSYSDKDKFIKAYLLFRRPQR